MSKISKLALALEMIESAESSLRSAKQIVTEIAGTPSKNKEHFENMAEELEEMTHEGEDAIVEGVFNGQIMTDKNKKEYPVPANYASKSKLVPGDILKLTIKQDGSFVYKQIGPVERNRIIGTLTYEDGQYKVIANGKAYNVLLASVTYYKGEIGDKVTLIVPAMKDSDWGAIENILPKDEIDLEEE